MQKMKDMLWTWLMPEVQRIEDREEWLRHGGKWIIFDRKDKILDLAQKLESFIDSGEIKSAKYWNKDPSAICVYSLDKDREKTLKIIKDIGAGNARVWEYDYAWDKNIRDPVSFIYSWGSKFRTILLSYGISGTLQLIKEILKPYNSKQ